MTIKVHISAYIPQNLKEKADQYNINKSQACRDGIQWHIQQHEQKNNTKIDKLQKEAEKIRKNLTFGKHLHHEIIDMKTQLFETGFNNNLRKVLVELKSEKLGIDGNVLDKIFESFVFYENGFSEEDLLEMTLDDIEVLKEEKE